MWRLELRVPVYLLALALLSPLPGNALSEPQQAAFQYHAMDLFMQTPSLKYKLGGKLSDGEVDCSLFYQIVCERAGLIEPLKLGNRTQAWRIYRGLDGFNNEPVSLFFGDKEIGDALCLAVPSSLERPYGVNHVGAIVNYGGSLQVIDANSSTGGIRIMPVSGIWRKWIKEDGWRRLKGKE